MQKLAVYSGSFNPYHEGHDAIVRYLEKHFEKVIVVVSPESPFKMGNFASGGERLEAMKKALEGRKAVVDDIEYHLERPLYTINTLRKIQEREGIAPVFAMGGDSLASVDRWHGHEDLLSEFDIMVFPRRGFDSSKIKRKLLRENPDYRIKLMRTRLVDISSTEIRNGEVRSDLIW